MADVSVRLRDIDEDNWMEVALLSTMESGGPKVVEEFIASNALSMVQAQYEETWITKAVYCGKKPVGFAMYGYNEEYDFYEISRLMIDYNHQDKGFGRIALKLIIEDMVERFECEEICLFVNKNNVKGKSMYESVGFEYTGDNNGDEEIYSLDLSEEED